MMATDVKLALENYAHWRGMYEQSEVDIFVIQSQMEGMSGSVIKIPDQPRDRSKFQNSCIMRKDKIRKSQAVYLREMEVADEFIASIPEPFQSMVIDKYRERIGNKALEAKYNYSGRNIRKIISRMIHEYCGEKVTEWDEM
jgi:hypothetical protein